MPVQTENIIPTVELTAADVSYYTAEALTIIDKFTITSVSSAVRTVSVHVVEDGGTAGDENLIVNQKGVLPRDTIDLFELVGHTLKLGDSVLVQASAGGALNLRASGRIVT